MTAKLSRKFYDKLGDEVANELVDWFNTVDLSYRSEIREMFETNFSRFEARLAQQTAELRAEMAALRGELRAEFKEDLAKLQSELNGRMLWLSIATVVTTLGGMLALSRLFPAP